MKQGNEGELQVRQRERALQFCSALSTETCALQTYTLILRGVILLSFLMKNENYLKIFRKLLENVDFKVSFEKNSNILFTNLLTC